MDWISVEDKLPEKMKKCLLYTPCDDYICVGFYDGNDNWQKRDKWKIVTAMRSTKTLTKKVSHWMPLPETPDKKDGWISVEDKPEPDKDGLYKCKGYWLGSGKKTRRRWSGIYWRMENCK